VTRQYDEVRRTKRICLVFATLLIFASEFRICGFAIQDLFMSGAKLQQLCSFGCWRGPVVAPLKAQVAE
jgi:hypothetical protein